MSGNITFLIMIWAIVLVLTIASVQQRLYWRKQPRVKANVTGYAPGSSLYWVEFKYLDPHTQTEKNGRARWNRKERPTFDQEITISCDSRGKTAMPSDYSMSG
ncbi:MAG: hypothetical protein KBS83_04825, partial [Lachnospiraceae bacterium]|nr:hypothetical protein [Candidatus Equihabitans merdae]